MIDHHSSGMKKMIASFPGLAILALHPCWLFEGFVGQIVRQGKSSLRHF